MQSMKVRRNQCNIKVKHANMQIIKLILHAHGIAINQTKVVFGLTERNEMKSDI